MRVTFRGGGAGWSTAAIQPSSTTAVAPQAAHRNRSTADDPSPRGGDGVTDSGYVSEFGAVLATTRRRASSLRTRCRAWRVDAVWSALARGGFLAGWTERNSVSVAASLP